MKTQTSILILLPYVAPFTFSIHRTEASIRSLGCETSKILTLVRNLHTYLTDACISHLFQVWGWHANEIINFHI